MKSVLIPCFCVKLIFFHMLENNPVDYSTYLASTMKYDKDISK